MPAVLTAALFAATPAAPQDGESLFGVQSASVTYGPYVRLDLGGAMPDPSGAFWDPPGASDPRISFDASADDTAFGAIGLGFDWQNGIRADVSLFATGTSDVTAPCASASDGSPCSTHASITDASVSTRGVMASVYYAPLEAQGSNAPFQPFVVAGVGIARNEVGDWTRENPTSGRPTRTFEGGTSSGLAWSLGIGASYQVTRPGRWPVIIEAAWRYYDFVEASGGSTPLPGFGGGEPREPFTFDNTSQVVTFGIRVPLQRY
jgi:opacity protein-like surface antigen